MKEILEQCADALERGVDVITEYEHRFGRLSVESGNAWTDMIMARDKLLKLIQPHKDIADMTTEELNSLPEYQEFGCTRYEIVDGKVTLPDGRAFEGLTGKWLNIPKRQELAGAYFVGGKTPLMWNDAEGKYWRPVRLLNGEWRKQRL